MPILADFRRIGQAELGGEKSLGLRVSGGFLARAFPLVFRQSGRIKGLFFTRTKSGGFTGFSDSIREINMANGAQFGFICP